MARDNGQVQGSAAQLTQLVAVDGSSGGFLQDAQLDTDGMLAANSDTKVASQKAVKTYADAVGTTAAALVSDTAYDATSWNGVTTIAPSKNAVRDKLAALGFSDLGGNASIAQIVPISYSITGVNFNSANTDNQIAITLPAGGFTRYTVGACRIDGASGTLTTATCGLFTAAAAGGVAIVASGSAITVNTASDNTNNNCQGLTIVNQNTEAYAIATVPTLYFRVQNAQGSAATANVTVSITPLP